MKKCPYCTKQILDAETLCPYCGRDLVPPDTPKPEEAEKEKKSRGLRAGVILFLILLTAAKIVNNANWAWPPQTNTSVSNASDATLAPPTPSPTKTPTPCTWWYEISNGDIGETICVQGVADSIIGNTESSPMTRIYFRSNLPEGSVGTKGSATVFYFVDHGYYYRGLKVGDCVSATGRISMNEAGRLFIRLDGSLNTCP